MWAKNHDVAQKKLAALRLSTNRETSSPPTPNNRAVLVSDLATDSLTLVDAYGIPDEVLGAPIAVRH